MLDISNITSDTSPIDKLIWLMLANIIYMLANQCSVYCKTYAL